MVLRGGTTTGGREAMYIGTSGFHEGRDEQSPCVALVDHIACRCRRPRDRRDVCDDIDWKTGLRALEGNLLVPLLRSAVTQECSSHENGLFPWMLYILAC